ncbi:MAG: TSUP family transporter [Hyphomicrobiales bacterium]
MIGGSGTVAILGLSAASFLTSVIAATLGIGGGLGLLSVMPSFVPMAAVVPLHGMTQLVSNGSRFLFDYRHAETRLLPAYLAGACLGGAAGYYFIGRVPDLYLSAVLGGFILLSTWTDLVKKLGKLVTNFFSIAFVQTFLSLFVASVGLISQPVLIKQGLSKNKVIVTHAMQMSVLHGLKVFTFVVAGFPFIRYWQIMAVMIGASAAGSYFGGFFRDWIPEKPGLIALKSGITFFALKMIADAVMTA